MAKIPVLVALLCVAGTAAHSDAFTPALLANVQAEGQSQFMTGVRGSCTAASHIARGPVGANLTNHQTPFVCDAAVLAFFDKQNQHVLVNFAEKATTTGVLAFSGIMEPDGIMLNVSKVYFEPGKPTYVDVGVCKFFFSGRHMKGIFCGGKIDADGQRTVATIAFEADRGQ